MQSTARLFVTLFLLVVLHCLPALAQLTGSSDYEESSEPGGDGLMSVLLKRRADMAEMPRFELPNSMIQQMLKYRRY